MIGLGGVIAVANHGHHRPEGAAERWLTAISDTTRKGVRGRRARPGREARADSPWRAPLLPSEDTNGKGAFPDLEVGKAARSGDRGARCPTGCTSASSTARTR